MKNRLLFLFLFLLTTNLFIVKSQVVYEKGYFIDNKGIKTECLINNKDWDGSPTEISYKTDNQSETKKINTPALEEFEIFGFSKYINKTVQIDKSSSDISNLSPLKNPVWQTERLLLKVLVEGNQSKDFQSFV